MGGLGGSGYSREEAGWAPGLHTRPGMTWGQPGPSLTLQRTLEPELCVKAPRCVWSWRWVWATPPGLSGLPPGKGPLPVVAGRGASRSGEMATAGSSGHR